MGLKITASLNYAFKRMNSGFLNPKNKSWVFIDCPPRIVSLIEFQGPSQKDIEIREQKLSFIANHVRASLRSLCLFMIYWNTHTTTSTPPPPKLASSFGSNAKDLILSLLLTRFMTLGESLIFLGFSFHLC